MCLHTQESVYFSPSGESDVDAMVRIMKMTPQEINARAAEVSLLQEAVYRDNDRTASAIMAQAVQEAARRRKWSHL